MPSAGSATAGPCRGRGCRRRRGRRRCGWPRRRAGRRAPRRPDRWSAPWTSRARPPAAGPGRTSCTPGRSSTVTLAGTFGDEQWAGVHRRRIQRIVVAGQQVHRNADGAHRLQRLADVPRGKLVVFEDVAGHDDEFGPGLGGQRTQAGDDVAAGGRIARLRLTVQEVTGHAELPVGGVHEPHLGPSLPSSCLCLASRV